MKRQLLAALLCGAMLTTCVPVQTVFAEETATVSENEMTLPDAATVADATEIGSGYFSSEENYTLQSGTYKVVGAVEATGRITISGDVTLILTDDCTLNANQGIKVQDNDNDLANGSPNALTITVPEESKGTGKLIATSSGEQNHTAAIGSDQGSYNTPNRAGTITINGGHVEVTAEATNGSNYAAAIGGGYYGAGGTTEIHNSTVNIKMNAYSNNYGAGIGGGYDGAGGTITIQGGKVDVAMEGPRNYGAGIGGGYSASESGTFSTGDSGNAVIITPSIQDQSGKANWHGIIFEDATGKLGKLYGDTVEPTTDWTVPAGATLTIDEGQTLTIPAGVTLINNGTITNNGTINNNGTIIQCGNLVGEGEVDGDGKILTKEIRPTIAIDYENETLIGFDASGSYTIDDQSVTPPDGVLPLSREQFGTTLEIVKKTTTGYSILDSAPQSLTIPARPTQPSVQGVNTSFKGESDGMIIGLTEGTAYEISNDHGQTWQDATFDGTMIKSLAAGTYEVRVKATDQSFASEAVEVTIGEGADRTYTLSVTAPTFDAVTYGYTQPAAKALTITSSGNSAATITSVKVDNDIFTIIEADNKTVPAGGTLESWTIQPAAGLNADTHTATVTVTYNNGATATATISFTVNKVDQAAPAAPELEEATTDSITLKTVAANASGATAEYSKDGGATWQDTPIFDALSPGTSYTFVVRYKGTDNTNASAVSATATFSTKSSSSGGGSITPPSYKPDVPESVGGTTTVTPTRPEKGDDVTITPKPEDGYEVDKVIVTDKNGNDIPVTKNDDGTYTFEQPSGKVTITVTYKEKEDPEPEPTPSVSEIFVDIAPDAWYIDAVQFAYDEGIMTGTSATTFAPEVTTSRGMIVAILHRLEDSPAAGGDRFADVAAGDWYADAVNWAAEEGIVSGMSADTFAPNAPITREQLAAILYNYAEYKGMDVRARADLSKYSDAASVSAWATDAFSWANAEGLVNGMTADILAPQGEATRAQVAAIFERFLTK